MSSHETDVKSFNCLLFQFLFLRHRCPILKHNLHLPIRHYQLSLSPFLSLLFLSAFLHLRLFLIFQKLLQLLFSYHTHTERILFILIVGVNCFFLLHIFLFVLIVNFCEKLRIAVKDRMVYLAVTETHLAEESALRGHWKIAMLWWNSISVVHHVPNRISLICLHWRVEWAHQIRKHGFVLLLNQKRCLQ